MLKAFLLGLGFVISIVGVVFYALSGTKTGINNTIPATVINTPTPIEAVNSPNEPNVEEMYATYKACLESTPSVTQENPTIMLNTMEKSLPNVKFVKAENKILRWIITLEPTIQETEVLMSSAKKTILPSDDMSISDYLKSIGYHDDVVNTGSATVLGFVSYYKGCNICRMEMETVDVENLAGDYKVTLSCGILNAEY